MLQFNVLYVFKTVFLFLIHVHGKMSVLTSFVHNNHMKFHFGEHTQRCVSCTLTEISAEFTW